MFLGYLISASWPPKQGHVVVLSYRMGLKLNCGWLLPQALYHHYSSISCKQDIFAHPRVCGWFGVYVSLLIPYDVRL